ncbi:MAG: hypothetical protein AB7T63_00255 [Planctomycetota bacterium]
MSDAVLESPLQLERGEVVLVVIYKNWRGETSIRRIKPHGIWFGTTQWHPHPQWLLNAFDLEKQAERSFALSDFVSVKREAAPEGDG